MSGYMNGINQEGLELVTKVTKLLNSLTEEDYEDTYAYIRVQLIEEGYGSPNERVLGYWLDEHGPGCWSYFDGPPKTQQHESKLTLHEVRQAVLKVAPKGSTLDEEAVNRIAAEVISLLKERS